MSQAEDTVKQHFLPPSSYEETVFGTTSTNKQNGNNPFADSSSHTPDTPLAVHYSPEQLPTTQLNSQQHTPYYYSQQHHTPNIYSLCPPGGESLCNVNEILVYHSIGKVFQIKDQDKVTIMTVTWKLKQFCCNCCTYVRKITYNLRNVDGQVTLARATLVLYLHDWCSYRERLLDVEAPLDVHFGFVRIQSYTKSRVENRSQNILYNLERENNCCEVSPYQIYNTDGQQVGQINHSWGIKHRLMVPKEMLVKHKILLLFLTVHLQFEADFEGRSF